MAEARTKHAPVWRPVIVAALLVVAMYVILPQLDQFNASWGLLRKAEPAWLVGATGLIAGTYCAAAATYCFLSFKPLPYSRTVLVELAAMFVNRLLPAGVGAIGTNYAYLRRQHHSVAQAGSIVALNNLLGMLGHGLLLAIVALWNPSAVALTDRPHDHTVTIMATAIAGAAALVAVALLFRNRRRLQQVFAELQAQVMLYARKPWRLPLALSSSMLLTLCNVLALFCCARALGIELPFTTIFLVFSAGVAAGTVTPTPGGVGGFEAGLAAAFIAYGVGGAPALAVALLFRLISYWLALAVGAVAFLFAQQRRVFSAS